MTYSMFARNSNVIILGLVLISVACSKQNVTDISESGEAIRSAVHSDGNHGRFIIDASDNDLVEKEVKKEGDLFFLKKLKHGGTVVEGSEKKVMALAAKLNGRYERDVIFSIPIDMLARSGGSTTPPPAQTVPWGIAKVRAAGASVRGNGIKVCVSDTGVELNHPDLAQNIAANFNAISGSRSGNDDNGHGTHVAGTIAAIDNAIGVIGVAPQAKILAAKGLSKTGSGFSSDLAETIDWCREQGSHVINMSWGSASSNATIESAIQRAYDAGIILVAAAGNEAGAVIYPAALSGVVAVSAVDINEKIASFSNTGSDVENSAPGVNILSTYKGSTYKVLNGTSMASPHVAGVAALMLSALPTARRDHLLGVNIGLSLDKQGSRGRIDAVLSTTN